MVQAQPPDDLLRRPLQLEQLEHPLSEPGVSCQQAGLGPPALVIGMLSQVLPSPVVRAVGK